MLPSLNLPVSLLGVLMTVRPCFTAPAFTTFCGLVAGLAGQVRRRTVCGMLLGACLRWPHDRAHYFFSRARWELDEVGVTVAFLVVMMFLDPGADIIVALDDSVSVRTGKHVYAAGWQHDGSARNLQKLSAPRGALSYPRFSREEFEGRFLGLMPYPELKGEGDHSMAEN